jgi:protein TonB
MNILNTTRWQQSSERPSLLIYCLILSICFHLLGIMIIPLFESSEETLLQQRPTIVRLIDKPPVNKEKPVQKDVSTYEIDPLPVQPEPPLPVESPRKADKNQKVVIEQAPEGKDVRDQTTATAKPRPQKAIIPPKTPPQPTRTAEKKLLKTEKADIQPTLEAEKRSKTSESVSALPRDIKQSPPVPPPVLTPEQLRPDTNTLDQIASDSTADRNRIKERSDVKVGDTIWLNLQDDLLVSFFRRFHDQVERVWNYPTEAATQGIEGILELWIIVDKNGELLDVDLRQSSGSDILDFEAIQAVYRAAPFGPLTRHYPHEKLNIRAHFRYSIVGKYIYGRQ